MKYEIQNGPSFSLLEVTLDPGEKIVSESGAMAWMSPNLQMETTTRGGALAGLKRKFLTGESFFQNTYQAVSSPGVLGLAPGAVGEIIAYPMQGGELLLEKGAYLASTADVHCDAKFSGLKGLFSEGLFVLRVTGQGLLFFNSYGSVEELMIDGSYIVDNGYAVAWEPSLTYRVTKSKKIRSFLFSDQLLLHFSGKGRLWVQSRSPRQFANWVHPFRRVKSRG